MIRLLTGFPENVLAARCQGHVTRKDYEEVLSPAVNAALQQHAKLRIYYEVPPQFTGIDAGAVWDDFRVGGGICRAGSAWLSLPMSDGSGKRRTRSAS